MKKFLLPFLIIFVAVTGAVTLMATAPVLEPSAAVPVATKVKALTVSFQSLRLTVASQGTVLPAMESDLISEVSGRVVRMSPSMVSGGYFSKGDTLLELDSVDYRTDVSRAKAALARAKAELEYSHYELQRQQKMSDRQLSSRSALEKAQRTFRVSEATEQESQLALDQARRDLERTRFVAPFTGIVRTEQVDIGQFVTRGTTVAKIYATNFSEVRLPLADRQLAFLNLPIGTRGILPEANRPKVSLQADYAGQRYQWQGEIVRTESEIDLMSRMVYVVARINNDTQKTPLTVGMYVEAEIDGLLAENVVVLPRNTLRNGNQVLVIDAQNRLHHRKVELLRLYQDEVLIKSGLEVNERVCITAIQTVVDGMLVDPVLEEI